MIFDSFLRGSLRDQMLLSKGAWELLDVLRISRTFSLRVLFLSYR